MGMHIQVLEPGELCPFRALGHCTVSDRNNRCPTEVGTDCDGCGIYELPKRCPLRDGAIRVELVKPGKDGRSDG